MAPLMTPLMTPGRVPRLDVPDRPGGGAASAGDGED